MKRKVLKNVLVCGCVLALLTGCGGRGEQPPQDMVENFPQSQGNTSSAESAADLASYEDTFTSRDLEQTANLSAAVYVNLADDGTTVDGRGANVEGNIVTITDEGVYVISGTLSDGQLVVEAAKEDKVQLVLEGANITNDTSAALYVKQADKVFITTGAGTDNSFRTTGIFSAIDDNNIDGAVFAKDDIVFNGEGTLKVVCVLDHGIVGKDDVKVTGGTITVDAKGDGIQANDGVYIAGGTVSVLNSNEGIEGEEIAIWGGNITVIAKDDGLNAAGGNDESGFTSFGGNNPFDADLSCSIAIYGGILNVDAVGDGLDSNGNLYIYGGEIYVDGPTSGGDGAIDYGGSGVITGGILVAAGSSQMAENMGQDSTQCTMLVTFGNQMTEGEIKVTDDAGNVILTYTPDKKYSSAVISHPDLEVGKTYTVSAGETSTEVTFDSVVYGSGMMGGGHGGFGGGGKDGGGQGGRGQRPGW